VRVKIDLLVFVFLSACPKNMTQNNALCTKSLFRIKKCDDMSLFEIECVLHYYSFVL